MWMDYRCLQIGQIIHVGPMLSFSPKWAKCSFSYLLHENLLCWMWQEFWGEATVSVCVCVCVCVCALSHLWLFETLWTIAHQLHMSMEFSRQEYWSRLSFSSPGDLPDLGMEPSVSCISGGFFTILATREALESVVLVYNSAPWPRFKSKPGNQIYWGLRDLNGKHTNPIETHTMHKIQNFTYY